MTENETLKEQFKLHLVSKIAKNLHYIHVLVPQQAGAPLTSTLQTREIVYHSLRNMQIFLQEFPPGSMNSSCHLDFVLKGN